MKKLLVMAVIVLLGLSGIALADSITLKSGNAAIGQSDPRITVSGKQMVFNGQTISAAPFGLQQAIVTNGEPSWISLDGSKWVRLAEGVVPYGGYSYKIEFQMPTSFSLPSMSVAFSSDNGCNVLLNGSLIGTPSPPKAYAAIYHIDISTSSLFNQGSNILEFDVMNGEWLGDWGGPSGVLFSADVIYTTDTTAVPEPSSILAALSILAPAGFMFRRMK